MVHETVTMEGHLIDSDILRRVFNHVVEEGGGFEVLEFRVGTTNQEPSFARLSVTAPAPEILDRILERLNYLCASAEVADARFAPARRREAATSRSSASCPTTSRPRPTRAS